MNSYTYVASAEYEATLFRPMASKQVEVTIFLAGNRCGKFQVESTEDGIDYAADWMDMMLLPPILRTKILRELDQHAAAWEQHVELAEFIKAGSDWPFDRVTTVAVVLAAMASVLFIILS